MRRNVAVRWLLGAVLLCAGARVVEAQSACAQALGDATNYAALEAFSGSVSLLELEALPSWNVGEFSNCQSAGGNYCTMNGLIAMAGLCLPQECDIPDLADPASMELVKLQQRLTLRTITACASSLGDGPSSSAPSDILAHYSSLLSLPVPEASVLSRLQSGMNPLYPSSETLDSFAVFHKATTKQAAAADPSPECLNVLNGLAYVGKLNSTITTGVVLEGALAPSGSHVVVKCGDHKTSHLSDGAIIMIILTALFGVLCICGAFINTMGPRISSFRMLVLPPPVVAVREPLLDEKQEVEEYVQESQPVPVTGWRSWVACFDVMKNSSSLFKERAKGTLSIFDGLRSFSMMWVVFGHVFVWQMTSGFVNGVDVYPPTGIFAKWPAQVIFSGELAVDSFFYLSGFLVTYSMVKKLETLDHDPLSRAHKTVPLIYLHRFLRLSPAYFFALFFQWQLQAYLSSGPYYDPEFMVNECHKYWWANLLYVNNFVPFGKGINGCFGHSWYLANDMQFFILSPIFIYPFIRRRNFGLAMMLVTTLASFIWACVIVDQKDLSAFPLDGDASALYQRKFYQVPWLRWPVYLVGMSTAMLWIEWKRRAPKSRFSDVTAIVINLVGLLLLGLTCYGGLPGFQQSACTALTAPNCGSYNKVSDAARVAYTALSRPAWGVGLALLSVLSFEKQLFVPIEYILSHPWLVPVARLSYTAYLAHPLVLGIFLLSATTRQAYTWQSITVDFLGCLCLAFMAALFLTLLVEKPFINLEKKLFERAKK